MWLLQMIPRKSLIPKDFSPSCVFAVVAHTPWAHGPQDARKTFLRVLLTLPLLFLMISGLIIKIIIKT